MAESMAADLLVVGGGIVGVATALELQSRHPARRVVLVEKENVLARHQTGHNSGVIHSGIYYQPQSLKAEFCRRGAASTKRFAAEHGIPFRECGKLLVATSDDELGRLEALRERAGVNDIAAETVDSRQLARLEPHVRGVAALLLRETAIIDYGRVAAALAEEFMDRGGIVLLGQRVLAVHETAAEVALTLSSLGIRAARVVFCAGLQADRLAGLAGLSVEATIVPFRGEYYTVVPELRRIVRHLIYPVPDPELPFLGVHLSPTIDGELTVGPNAVLGLAREKYPKGSVDLRDALELATSSAVWRVAAANVATGLRESYNSVFKSGYLREVRRYCPSLSSRDLVPREAGIRAQAVLRDGTLVHDFLIRRTERTVHVLNAPSPAATSAMPIGEYLAALIDA